MNITDLNKSIEKKFNKCCNDFSQIFLMLFQYISINWASHVHFAINGAIISNYNSLSLLCFVFSFEII